MDELESLIGLTSWGPSFLASDAVNLSNVNTSKSWRLFQEVHTWIISASFGVCASFNGINQALHPCARIWELLCDVLSCVLNVNVALPDPFNVALEELGCLTIPLGFIHVGFGNTKDFDPLVFSGMLADQCQVCTTSVTFLLERVDG